MIRFSLFMKILVALVVVGLSASCAAPSVKKGKASRIAAIAMVSEGRWREAEAEATRALEEVGKARSEIRAVVIDCKVFTCDSWSVAYAEQMDEIAKYGAILHGVRGLARFEQQDYSGARADAEQAATDVPDFPLAHYVLVRIYDHENNMEGVKKELIKLYGSKDKGMNQYGMRIKSHYLEKRGADWSSETVMVQRDAAEYLKSQGWMASTVVVSVKAPPNDTGNPYIYTMSLPAGWEELGGSQFVNQTVKRIQPERDYDDVGAIVSVVPMRALVFDGPVSLDRYHALFVESLKAMKYDVSTMKPYPEMSKPGKQIAFWIKSPTQSGKELVIEQVKGDYVAVLSLIVLRNIDTFIDRYKNDAQRIISSITIEKMKRLTLSQRLKMGESMTPLDRYRATQEGHFSIDVKAPKGWNMMESFEEGKWVRTLEVPGDINLSGALRVVMLKPEFGYSKSKYPDYWDFIASQSYVPGMIPMPLHSFSALTLSDGWQARISDMKYDPGRTIFMARRQGDYVLIYTFVLVQSIAPRDKQAPNGFELAAASNPMFQKYKSSFEQFTANTKLTVH